MQENPWENTGKYEKSGRLIGVHRVISQKDGYITNADKRGTFFTLHTNGDIVINSIINDPVIPDSYIYTSKSPKI
ncbi:hypothetical protein [Anditalea andensis]|uniref:Uncharacterized protein n=1 Tax=Anditalea andensis TaxID=1048983 RepID=A0A074KTV5_9BACT|nr:hypothetical protein [Anditalea andensis]KEO71675.1 hypothetical protein EL17_23235 [Anditalea andensis]